LTPTSSSWAREALEAFLQGGRHLVAGKYLNNLIEQDHRAIKRRCASMAGFKSFDNAAITLAGIELAHRIRKNQFSFGRGRRRRGWSRKAEWAMALA
jgi:transposase-like protein